MAPRRKRPDEELMEPVGDSLLSPLDVRRMRCRIGLFQAELAEQCGVSLALVQCWERGTRSISRDHAAHLYTLHRRAMEGDYVPLRKRDPRKHILKNL
jgi:DNA-binding transcriptional regulator YiaG